MYKKALAALLAAAATLASMLVASGAAQADETNEGNEERTYVVIDAKTNHIDGTFEAPLTAHGSVPSSAYSVYGGTASTDNPFKRVTDASTADFSPVAMIGKSEEDGISNSCSAAFVARNVLITSAHCIWEAESAIPEQRGPVGVNVVYPAINGEDPSAPGTKKLTPVKFVIPDGWKDSSIKFPNMEPKDVTADYGLIVTEEQYDSYYGYGILPLYSWSGWPTLSISGYPNPLNEGADNGKATLRSHMWTENGEVTHICVPRDDDKNGNYANCDDVPMMETSMASLSGLSGAALVEGIGSDSQFTNDRTVIGVNKGFSASTGAERAIRLDANSTSVIDDVVAGNRKD